LTSGGARVGYIGKDREVIQAGALAVAEFRKYQVRKLRGTHLQQELIDARLVDQRGFSARSIPGAQPAKTHAPP
jgi:hypothetical protein